MSAGRGRADRHRPVAGVCGSALVILMLLGGGGCRDNSAGPLTPHAHPPVVILAVGDSLLFNTWGLDIYGDPLPGSYARTLWHVTAVADSFAGRQGVTTVLESAFPAPPTPLVDTLHFAFMANGDIYQFGFLALAVKRGGGPTIRPVWDRIAALSLPIDATWVVGPRDSAGGDFVQGFFEGQNDYFSTSVNGVNTLCRGYTVTMTGTDLSCALTVTDAPSAVLVFEQDATSSATGLLRILSSLTTGRPL